MMENKQDFSLRIQQKNLNIPTSEVQNKTEISKVTRVPLPQLFICQKASHKCIAIGQRTGRS
jgi:hypothetical protein